MKKFHPVIIAAICLGSTSMEARAEYKVRSPIVESGELGIETVGNIGSDKNPAKNNEKSSVYEIEYGVTDYWQTELEGELGRDPGPGDAEHYLATTFGNQFQFFQQGSQWLELALWTEFSRSMRSGNPN